MTLEEYKATVRKKAEKARQELSEQQKRAQKHREQMEADRAYWDERWRTAWKVFFEEIAEIHREAKFHPVVYERMEGAKAKNSFEMVYNATGQGGTSEIVFRMVGETIEHQTDPRLSRYTITLHGHNGRTQPNIHPDISMDNLRKWFHDLTS